jgi:hydrogenase maturation protease
MNTLILGIGNPILTDDGVGIKVARSIKEKNPDLEVIETSEAGMSLLEDTVDYDKLIIIDSIKTGQGKTGELYKLELEDLKPSGYFPTSHGLDIATAFELGQKLGYKIPRSISIYAIEVQDNANFCEECTAEIQKEMPFIIKQIMEEENL